jgi:predicted glycoside hydrolase/deacetylase ChbG (UPF0249 family)
MGRSSPTKSKALLIVNADDWGSDVATTDAIGECFEAGAVTSISAMVFMADSERAAGLAVERALPVGLHINLTEGFSAEALDGAVRSRQARLVRYFAGPKWRMWGFSPRLFAQIESAIADQLTEFRRLYGREPSHFDGHHHVHQSLSVLFARTLPRGAKMRPSFTFRSGEKSVANRAVRGLLNRTMLARFATPRYFFAIEDIHPQLGGAGLEERLARAGGSTVEVMTHPGDEQERSILLSPAWRELIATRRVGGYADL